MEDARKVVENVSDMFLREVKEFSIREFHPLPNGEGEPTEVHIVLEVQDFPGTIVMRLKSRAVCTETINALARHRDAVFKEGV